MGDVSRRTGVVPDIPPVNQELSSLTDTQPTESDIDDDDDSDDYFHYDFPQPPSITPVLRRMRSSPWYSQQLEAITKPERRYSASPLIQHPDGWAHPLLRSDLQNSASQDAEISRELARMGLVSRDVSENSNEEKRERLNPPLHRDTFPSRRLDRLPPPAPAPSIPLPRLPRIIRKVASMRSESKKELLNEPGVVSRRPVPKIRSLKFMSGSMLGSSSSQPTKHEERKRSWSLSRPTSFQRPKAVPVPEVPYITLNSTNDHLSALCDQAPSIYASSAVYSNPYLIGSNPDRHMNNMALSPEGHFDLSKGASSLAPPFAHGATRRSDNASHRYSNTGCGESTLPGFGTNRAHERPGSGQHPPSHPLYNINSGGNGRNASSGALLHGAKSFINITPERQKGKRSRPKSGSGVFNTGNESGGVGHQVGSTMKVKGERMKKLFARASSGVVDWGRQLTGRTMKPVHASSTSGSLAPLTGMQS
ncbi:hypothetical protein D9756_005237 [Leucocoprinus leucothites]|uniref:Uncharacterized protein n=1 Tax=Leucocoprinus leucothites TaxID=201217 RepID=A0A8H5D8J5_9AGAR|nr:hypothetical protein D9756_005237 [Leucoagaricus leucothites]